MNPSSLAILHTNFHRGWGGQPAWILMLCIGLVRRGHRVTIAAPAGSILSARARQAGIETFEEPRFLKSKHLVSAFRDAMGVSRFLRSRDFDLINAYGSQDLWVSVLARAMSRAALPVVYSRLNSKVVADHLFNRLLYKRVIDHLIVAGAPVLDRYEAYFRRGDLTRGRVSVVHSSYWEEQFHPGVDGSAVRREVGADNGADSFLVGVVGRLVRDKGGIYFLQAAARLSTEFPRVRFLFAGRGTEEANLRAAARELGIADRVAFLGFREDVPQITAALDLSVLPSVDCDASPAVLKEAMAVGRPVVATSIGGAAEIVRNGETGLLVPPGDPAALARAIREILLRPDRGRAMGIRGRERVRAEFTQDRMVQQTLGAYQRALQITAPTARVEGC